MEYGEIVESQVFRQRHNKWTKLDGRFAHGAKRPEYTLMPTIVATSQ
jgi:hypothetical protein